LATSRLTTSRSQRLNRGKPLGTGCCEWLWSNGTLSILLSASGVSRLTTSRLDTTNHSDRWPRGFPLFKRYEWLVSNRFVSKRRPPLLLHACLYPHYCNQQSSSVYSMVPILELSSLFLHM